MIKYLNIAAGVDLPLDTVTQTIGILAKRRAGKSYCARRIVEQLYRAGQQVIIVDPKGDWHGIRSSADGKQPGLPVIILGGEHGDIPLEVSSGEMVAKLAVEERVSILLDLSLFRKHEVATFMTAFLENLYRLKAREVYRTPVMLCIDEADAIAPQKPQKGEERMLGAAEDIVRRGGQRGIGCMLVTQRSAVLNKNVLTQVGVLVTLRTIAPQDLEAMKAWIDVHGTLAQQKTLMDSLPSLPVGDAWFWSPGWPTEDGIFKRVHVHKIETFDSGATPKPGEKRIEPKKAADIDLEALRRAMADTVKRAEANDPKKLQQRVADLQRQLAAAQASPGKSQANLPDNRERIAALEAERNHYKQLAAVAERTVGKLFKRYDALRNSILLKNQQIAESLQAAAQEFGAESLRVEEAKGQAPEVIPEVPTLARRQVPVRSPRSDPHSNAEVHMPPGERAVLTAAIQHSGVERKNLTVLTGYKRSSRDAYISRLLDKGLIRLQGSMVLPTETGIALLAGEADPLPVGRELIEFWMDRLPEGEKKTLAVLLKAGGQNIPRSKIDDETGYRRSSRDAYLSRLKARGLVEFTGAGTVKASDLLFPEGLS